MEINDASKGMPRHSRPDSPREVAPTFGLLLYAVLNGLTPATRTSRGGSHRARRGQSRGA